MPIELEEGEELLTDVDELLWRNAHPAFVDEGVPTSQLFRLKPQDEGKLSTARSSVVNARDHFEEYTGSLRLASSGVWGGVKWSV